MTPQPIRPAPPLDFGGSGPLVHLAHANGFPPGTYRPLADTLIDRYRVIALPARPLWPGSRPEGGLEWHVLVDDLIQGLDRLSLNGNLNLRQRSVVGLGHSMGGVLTLQAAVRRPDLFRALVLIDPVILPPRRLWALRLAAGLGLGRRRSLVRGALRRRRRWPSRQACYEHYRAKPLFAAWPDASLWAYVEAGTRERPDGGVELVYSPEWEARIFATPPTDVWRAVPRLRTPALLIRGAGSRTFSADSQVRMQRMVPHARFAVIPGAGHLVPMERPAETGAAIRDFLERT